MGFKQTNAKASETPPPLPHEVVKSSNPPPCSNKAVARDFVKEAKGKTFSLIVAALSHNYGKGLLSEADMLGVADVLLKGIEDRGYF